MSQISAPSGFYDTTNRNCPKLSSPFTPWLWMSVSLCLYDPSAFSPPTVCYDLYHELVAIHQSKPSWTSPLWSFPWPLTISPVLGMYPAQTSIITNILDFNYCNYLLACLYSSLSLKTFQEINHILFIFVSLGVSIIHEI